MRAKQFINEIQPIRDIEPGNLVTVDRQYRDNTGSRIRKLPGNNPWGYKVVDNGSNIGIFIFDDEEIIGKLELETVDFPLKRAVRSDYITVHEDYTGMASLKQCMELYYL